VLAFISILVGGLCGGLIGYGFTGLECEGDCSTWLGFGTLVGALLGAGGIAVVASLAMRAMGEWSTIRTKNDPEDPHDV